MSFFDRIRNGFSLAKSSFKVLRLDPELMLFPLASGIACLAVCASYLIPILGMGEGFLESLADDAFTGNDILAGVMLFLFYFATYFIIIFFNSALVACAIIRFKGGDPTVKDGIQAALSSIHYIMLWALVAATVGFVLKIVESRSENAGRLIAGLMGAAWSMLTYFVVPILVVEQQQPWPAFKRSKDVMLKTWGETFSASFSLGLINMLIFFVAGIPIIAGIALAGSAAVVGYILIGIGVLTIIGGVLCTSALETILLAGLYIYAEEGIVPEVYDASTFSHAFK